MNYTFYGFLLLYVTVTQNHLTFFFAHSYLGNYFFLQ